MKPNLKLINFITIILIIILSSCSKNTKNIKMRENIDNNKTETQDSTNWKAWYWGLMIFLAVQIALYLYITNLYSA